MSSHTLRQRSGRVVARALGLAALAGVALVAHGGELEAADNPVGAVTYVDGEATVSRGGADTFAKVDEGAKVYSGDRIKTGQTGRLEAKLNDGSVLRLSSGSDLRLDNAKFDKKNPSKKQVKAKLFVGRVWAAVTKLFGNDSEFEVTTTNAVAGVRGTRFNASQAEDGTAEVKVYSGKVLVSNKPMYAVQGATKAKRVEVKGPSEISKDKWEQLVAGAMQAVRISANGELSKAESFALTPTDDWESWNAERDRLAGIKD